MLDTDYGNEEFPSAACILDYLRCSITFKRPEQLVQTVNYIIDKIENNKVGSISKILRIKNGFSNVLKWNPNKLSDYGYVDLKMNVIFNNKSNTESQIVEIQFLLDFLLHAKKIGHKYYGIKRKHLQVHSVNNIMDNRNNNYNKFQTKILAIIKDKDLNQFAPHLFFRPNCILSMINYNNFWGPIPYLFDIVETKSSKMVSLFLDCLFHFGEIVLNESINKGGKKSKNNKLFVEKYLNFSLGHDPITGTFNFVELQNILIC